MTTVRELETQIAEAAGFDLKEVPLPSALIWHPRRTAIEVSVLYAAVDEPTRQKLINDMNTQVFKAGQPCPLNTAMTVVALFHDDEEARVYCVDARPATELMQGDGKGQAPACYRCSKANPVYVLERMTDEVFIQEVANEWKAIKEARQDAIDLEIEKQRVELLDTIVEALKTSSLATEEPFKDLLKELAEYEVPEDDEEEEEETEEETPPTTATGVAAASPASPPAPMRVPERPVA